MFPAKSTLCFFIPRCECRGLFRLDHPGHWRLPCRLLRLKPDPAQHRPMAVAPGSLPSPPQLRSQQYVRLRKPGEGEVSDRALHVDETCALSAVDNDVEPSDFISSDGWFNLDLRPNFVDQTEPTSWPQAVTQI